MIIYRIPENLSPAVTNANVKLHFANERMDIYSQQGQLVNLDASISECAEQGIQSKQLMSDIEHSISDISDMGTQIATACN